MTIRGQSRYARRVKDDVRTLPKQYHNAIEHWQRHNFPDYPKLAEEWDRFFPKDEPFCLCAKIAEDIPTQIEVGERKGEAKALAPKDLPEEAAQHLLMQIKARSSTGSGSTSSRCRRSPRTSPTRRACRRCSARRPSTWPPA